MMDDESDDATFLDELALLIAMYPDEVAWNEKNEQLTFKHEKGLLELRIPHEYPLRALPQVIVSKSSNNDDLRTRAKSIIAQQTPGTTCIDAILSMFIDLLEQTAGEGAQENPKSVNFDSFKDEASKTVIIWTHHLLATSKRKLALSSTATSISGITKPGYPGVMIFSGFATDIDAHVQELKQQRWQAFQVRCELNERWSFAHGTGIIEVETMGEVTKDVEQTSEQKSILMKAMKLK